MSRGSVVILPTMSGYVTDPYRRRSHRQNSVTSRLTHLSQVYHLEMRCCRVEVLLVTMQTGLGLAVTGLGLYMLRLSSSLLITDCPFWAGLPLFLAGIADSYYCVVSSKPSHFLRRSGIPTRILCVAPSCVCILVCIVAAIFSGFHGNIIATYDSCLFSKETDVSNSNNITTVRPSTRTRCACHVTGTNQSNGALIVTAVHVYDSVATCDVIMTSIKDYLILQCAFNTVAAGVSLWFARLVWKVKSHRRYSSDFFARWRSASVAAAAIALDPTLGLKYATARHQQGQGQGLEPTGVGGGGVCCSPLLQHRRYQGLLQQHNAMFHHHQQQHQHLAWPPPPSTSRHNSKCSNNSIGSAADFNI